MAATEFGDRTAIVRLKQQLNDAVERAYALAWAIARLEGKPEGVDAERSAREAVMDSLAAPSPELDSNVVSFSRNENRGQEPARAEGGASAQETLLAILKENEASVRELQTALEDLGVPISPGNLSVMLSRLTQAGFIQRTGRGMYRYAR